MFGYGKLRHSENNYQKGFWVLFIYKSLLKIFFNFLKNKKRNKILKKGMDDFNGRPDLFSVD